MFALKSTSEPNELNHKILFTIGNCAQSRHVLKSKAKSMYPKASYSLLPLAFQFFMSSIENYIKENKHN